MSAGTGPALRWALLGASWIAETRLLPALRRDGHAVVSVVSGTRQRAEQFASAHGIDLATTDLVEGLEAAGAQAVYVSSTNDRHRLLAEAAAERGLHVLCEKPLADDLADAAAIVTACRGAGVVLGVNHHLVAAGTNVAIRRLAEQGAIGEVRGVRVHHARLLPAELRTWRLSDQPGAGVVPDVGSHDASLINALLAPRMPLEAAAIGVRQGDWDARSDDAAMSVVRYDGGVLAQTHDAFTTPHAPTRFEVLGSQGAIVGIDVLSQDPVGEIHLYTDRGAETVEPADRDDLYTKVVRAFCAATRGEGRPTVTGEEALLAARVAGAIAESARTGRRTPIEGATP
jgi:1,5-anhydro-D-fructose reductase (1,5-anhydro-D-mannitol-forming)